MLPVRLFLKTLLREDWNPIGLRADRIPPSEYYSYARELDMMLSKGADANSIARYLNFVAAEYMGLDPDEKVSMKVARKAVDYQVR
jgi:hypothetical protein